MAWVRFIAKIIIAILGPAFLALTLSRVWSALYPDPGFTHSETWSDQAFGLLIFGLLLLSIFLPILLTIREFQAETLAGASLRLSKMVKAPADKLWK